MGTVWVKLMTHRIPSAAAGPILKKGVLGRNGSRCSSHSPGPLMSSELTGPGGANDNTVSGYCSALREAWRAGPASPPGGLVFFKSTSRRDSAVFSFC